MFTTHAVLGNFEIGDYHWAWLSVCRMWEWPHWVTWIIPLFVTSTGRAAIWIIHRTWKEAGARKCSVSISVCWSNLWRWIIFGGGMQEGGWDRVLLGSSSWPQTHFIETRLTSDPQRSTCLCPSSDGIKGVYHTQPLEGEFLSTFCSILGIFNIVILWLL